jgi:hypothetical protein
MWIEAAPAEVQMKATQSLLAWNNCTTLQALFRLPLKLIEVFYGFH